MTTQSDTPAPSAYKGYEIAVEIAHEVATDGNISYTCVLTATELDSAGAVPLIFVRTLELSGAQAAVTNLWQPGSAPPQEQLDAELTGVGSAYMRALVDLVERGFLAIARTANRSPSDVKSRMGMTDSALQRREQ